MTAMLLGIGLLAAARDATAYCRTTTCDERVGDVCEKNDDGCVRTGAALRWRSLPIPYRFDSGSSEKVEETSAREAIRRAFDTWSNTTCGSRRTSLRFEELPDATGRKKMGQSGGSVPWLIYFRDDEWSHDKDSNEGDESLALTNQLFGKTTGFIEYADIEINTADFKFAVEDGEDGVDLEAVMTHEVGHYIGLAHSREQGSIMAPRYHPERQSISEESSQGLSDDDVKAVCVLYPPKADAPYAPPSGCSVVPSRTTSTTSSFGALLVGLFATFMIRRRTRT
jgi:hypothetical protein